MPVRSAAVRREDAIRRYRPAVDASSLISPHLPFAFLSKLSCDYAWNATQTEDFPRVSLSDFLLFHVPVTQDHLWLPGSFQALQPHWANISSRRVDIDNYFVGLVMATLTEQCVSVERMLEEYFCNIHPWFSVIIEPGFRKRLSNLHCEPCAETAMLLLAVSLVAGSHDQSSNDSRRTRIYQIGKYLFSFLQLQREPSLEMVQSGLLLVLYELRASRLNEASVSVGNCARLGYTLRLNIDHIQQEENLPWIEFEERRRVWCGLYMLDRIIYQVATEFRAPHAVEEPDASYRLPIDDIFCYKPKTPVPGNSYPSLSTPLEVPLCYFAREIQVSRILGQVQMLRRLSDADWSYEQFAVLDRKLMQFMEILFEQTPGSWAVLCGANAICLASAISLHQDRLLRAARGAISPTDLDTSFLAIRAYIKMVGDICSKFDALEPSRKIPCVPLPAVMCTGEAILAVRYLKQSYGLAFQFDEEPFQHILTYATRTWNLAGMSDLLC
ncbi:putative C6 transcription factor [Aspergillus fischeri NRRL 181]|uniref:Xylanolytic transcriptional activator regulatory domain-containing protein n=1 Tax=Neosartorya fischeri (strain ATCC 1020 / DSM 3700 / CBS 544.65 / FGSC A1164 / JCM 1740 / NRRL 181 / WB 181) TaxID=331117 RepID=A1DAE9_NEOFI|nr:uncharacterized protein NFIA_094590 [Aspergillus fischeri NRRL 181]EAW19839.1 predicted protein [Aspergillus fischeri NRRL 181]